MFKRKFWGQKTLILIICTLIVVSGWEISVRLDAMYKPVKMFFRLAFGENIPLSTAMTYFDWTIFEAPLWLAGCILSALLSLFLCRRRGGQLLLFPLCLILGGYGLMREGTFLTDLWRLVQPALLILIATLNGVNLLRPQKKQPTPSQEQDFSPTFTSAPRFQRPSNTNKDDSNRKSA